MGMANGESDTYFGTDVGENGAPKDPEIFFGLSEGDKKFFHPMCLYSKCSNFCGEFKYGSKNTKKISTP